MFLQTRKQYTTYAITQLQINYCSNLHAYYTKLQITGYAQQKPVYRLTPQNLA